MQKRINTSKIVKTTLVFLVLILVSCSSVVRTQIENKSFSPLSKHVKVYVFDDLEVPENSEYVGELKIGDTGFSKNCSYEEVIEKSRELARENGANLVRITSSSEPNTGGSTCYRIQAELYRNVNLETLALLEETLESRYKSQLPEDADYAKVYFYRPSLSYGYLVGYKITYRDSVIGRMRNGEKFEFITRDFGYREFKAMTENESNIYINIQPGGEYFVECAIKTGFLVGVPTMEQKDTYRGRKKYNSL
jgi:hypothetical protein